MGREALISTVCDLLTRMPSAQITRAEVARTLGVDPSLIRYYFRDRSTMLLTAVERMVNQLLAMASQGVDRSGNVSPLAEMRARIKATLKLNFMHPHFHALVTNEVPEMPQPEARALFELVVHRGADTYAAMVDGGRQQGRLRDIDARMLYIAIIGMMAIFTTSPQFVRTVMGDDQPYDGPLLDRYGDFICDLIFRGIQATPER